MQQIYCVDISLDTREERERLIVEIQKGKTEGELPTVSRAELGFDYRHFLLRVYTREVDKLLLYIDSISYVVGISYDMEIRKTANEAAEADVSFTCYSDEEEYVHHFFV